MAVYYDDPLSIPPTVYIPLTSEYDHISKWLREEKNVTSQVCVVVTEYSLKKLTDKKMLHTELPRDIAAIQMARQNAHEDIIRRLRDRGDTPALEELKNLLNLDTLPVRIEGFDISNTQGVLSVAAMVVFIDGVAAKKEYRHFRIKTVEGPNDFASMRETLGRRFAHALQEKQERAEQGLPDEGGKFSELPDLILIDGGPQQLAYAQEAMHAYGLDIPMFGLAERNEEIWLPGAETPICLDHSTPELQLVQRVRDEAHRFGIIRHRNLRRAGMTHSRLEDIPGVGPARRKALLKTFGSLKAIAEADIDTLKAAEGMNAPAAEAVYAYFRNLEKEKEEEQP